MIAKQTLSQNKQPQTSERQKVINWLVENNYPALPVAPAQPAEKYFKRDKKTREPERDKEGNLIPLFTGKNPSYLDEWGKPHLINHRQYQNKLPSDQDLRKWFANQANGVGTLGGWNNTVWLDLDVKQFSSKEECDRAFWGRLEAHPELAQTFLEESHSGGWRIGVKVKQKPGFTNFALEPGGKHVGEALGEGRFTVLAPTIGPSGNSYQSINRSVPVEVMTLESIGIYPTSSKTQRQTLFTPQPSLSYVPGSIPLEQLGNDTSCDILQGSCPTGDRSEALATALQEWYGWQNWTRDNNIPVTGTPEDLARYAGQQLGVDSDRVNRILKTIDPTSCQPAALHRGDEESCWKKICRLDKASFEQKCPAHIKDGIKTEWRRGNNTLPSGIGFSSRDYSSAKSAQKLSLKEAVVKAREILAAESDELVANIKLEEIREACGMSEFGWERKIIKPLKRDLEGDRFKFELLGLLQIDDQVERIRQQALLAPKYQMGAGLIEKAMSAMKQRTQTPEAQPLDLDGLFDMESQGLNWLIPGLLPRAETVVLGGAPKAGKTLLAIDAAFAVATGESTFLGEKVAQGKVLLISVDESAGSTKAKLINRGFRRGDAEQVKVMLSWDISQLGALEKTLEDFRPDLVIIDSLRRINKGSEISENSAEFADNIYTLKETLERYGAAGILIHHTNKDREAFGVHRLRGSSAIAGAVWGTWQLDQIPKPDPNNKKRFIVDPKDPTRTLSVFARDIEGQQLLIELNPENSSWTKAGEVGDSSEAQAERDTLSTRILKLLGLPVHATGLSGSAIIDLLDADEVDKRSVYNCLNRMVSKRMVNCKPAPGDKRYNIYSLPNCHTPEQSSANCHTRETSPPPPSPPPTDPVDDYGAESTTTCGFENSHHNSHHPPKISHHRNWVSGHSNEDRESVSEIVITPASLRGGEGVKSPTTVTVGSVTVVEDMITNPTAVREWGEDINDPWADDCEVKEDGEVGLEQVEETAIAPSQTATLATDADADKVVLPSPVATPVENEQTASKADVEAIAPPPTSSPTISPTTPSAALPDTLTSEKAEQIRQEILEIDCTEDFFTLKRNPQYTQEELNWVRKNLLNQQQRDRLKAIVETGAAIAPTPDAGDVGLPSPAATPDALTPATSVLRQAKKTLPEGTKVKILTGNYKGRHGIVHYCNGNVIYVKPENKPAQGYFLTELKISNSKPTPLDDREEETFS